MGLMVEALFILEEIGRWSFRGRGPPLERGTFVKPPTDKVLILFVAAKIKEILVWGRDYPWPRPDVKKAHAGGQVSTFDILRVVWLSEWKRFEEVLVWQGHWGLSFREHFTMSPPGETKERQFSKVQGIEKNFFLTLNQRMIVMGRSSMFTVWWKITTIFFWRRLGETFHRFFTT